MRLTQPRQKMTNCLWWDDTMKVTVTFENDSEEDGFDGKTSVERYNVDDLYSLAYVFGEATRSAGFTYVEAVAFEKDDGKMVFGDV